MSGKVRGWAWRAGAPAAVLLALAMTVAAQPPAETEPDKPAAPASAASAAATGSDTVASPPAPARSPESRASSEPRTPASAAPAPRASGASAFPATTTAVPLTPAPATASPPRNPAAADAAPPAAAPARTLPNPPAAPAPGFTAAPIELPVAAPTRTNANPGAAPAAAPAPAAPPARATPAPPPPARSAAPASAPRSDATAPNRPAAPASAPPPAARRAAPAADTAASSPPPSPPAAAPRTASPAPRPAAATPSRPAAAPPPEPQRTAPSAAVRAAAAAPPPSRVIIDPPAPLRPAGAAPYVAPLSGGVVRQASPLAEGGVGDDTQAIPLRPLPPPTPKPVAPPPPTPTPPPAAAPKPIALPPPAAVAVAPLPAPVADGGAEILLDADAASGPAPAPALVSVDVEAYADGLVPSALARGGLAGAVVVVVKDGQVILAKGYGYADRAKGRPMDAARTVIRPGSISKLFTWTAVMQLVEQGKLDLDTDVNEYLDFRIRDYQGQPLTLRHLMTHSAGFEESAKHLFAADPSRLRPLRAYLETVQPERIYPPGQVPAYSNYGVALAGYIVERAARQPFNDYIEQHVLMPLDMRRSTFRQPLPKGLAGDAALGYAHAGAAPIPFELVNGAPAGALSTTGRDMAHFMIAQLDQGRYRGVEILKPYTAQAMQRVAVRPIAGLDAMTLGFFRRDKHGLVAIGHGGATEAFQSNLVLLPEKRLGVFVSVDGPGKAGRALHRDLIDGLLKRYYPERGAPPATRLTARLHGKQLLGRYENSRQSASNFLAIARLLDSAVVTLNDDDTVSVSTLRARDGRIKRWREIEPYVWQEVDGDSRLAAKRVDGRIVAIGTDDAPPAMWLQPVPAWRSAGWMLPLFYAALAVHVLALALWPVAVLVRRHTRRQLTLDGRARDLRLLTFFGLIANLLLLALWAWMFGRIEDSPRMLDGQLDSGLRMAQLLGLLSVAAAAVSLLNVREVWRARPHRVRRICAVAMAAACVAAVWFVFALHTMQWSLMY